MDNQVGTNGTFFALGGDRASRGDSESRLEAIDNDYAAAEANLTKALALVQECEAAYRDAPAKLRRQFNQAFFKRLLIDDSYNVTGELAEPFETLPSEELRQAATRRAEADLVDAVEDVFRAGRDDTTHEPELALAGAGLRSNPAPTVRTAQGLKEKTMVGDEGLEPPTPCASCRCSSQLS